MANHHSLDSPSAWVARFAPMISPSGRVLDIACGAGRHTRLLATLGHPVVAVDLDLSNLGELAAHPLVTALQADLENAPWPLDDEKFPGVVVTNYLHRPLFPKILAALDSGGVLIYETFARGNERYGRPANPEFLLMPGELLTVVGGHARVVAYEDLIVSEPKPAAVQRICAIRC